MKRTGPTDVNVRRLVRFLRKRSSELKVNIWRDLAERISRPRRIRIEVNVGRIHRNTSAGDVVVVPGKVLGAGLIDHPVIVGALSFSSKAYEKIVGAGGKCLSISDLMNQYPNGSDVKILG